MNHEMPRIRRRGALLALAALSLVPLGVFAVLTAEAGVPNPFEAGSGPWMNPVYDASECPGDQICAEWPNPDNGTTSVCCIDDTNLGTYQGYDDTCQRLITVRAWS